MDRPDLPPLPPPDDSPEPARTIRRRLLERVADADTTHRTVESGPAGWQPFVEGVAIKVLRQHSLAMSYLLRLAPGASLPPHRHPQDEECLVLEGRLRVGSRLEIGPGGYHLAHRGALHATISTATGATVFLRGAVPDASQLIE